MAKTKIPKQQIDLGGGVQPSVRIMTGFRPQDILFAENAANYGNLRLAASLCEWMLGDDRIGPLLHMRVESLLSLTPTFEPSGDRRRSNRAVRAMEAEEDWWKAYPDGELAQIVLWGILLGVAPARHVWTTDPETGRLLPKPEFWHPQHLRWDMDTRRWMICVADARTPNFGAEQELVAGDGGWLLHTPFGRNRPWSMGLWRSLSRLAMLKQLAIEDWAQHSEKSSMLAASSSATTPSSAQERARLGADIYQRGRNGVVVLPSGFDLKLVESIANTRNLYQAQIEMANTAISIAIRGGNLTTEVKSGSLAAAQTQERLGDDQKRRFDAAKIVDTLHEQSLPYWALYNFGDPKLAPWPIYPTDERDDLVLKGNTMLTSAQALTQFANLGFSINRAEFAEHFELEGFLGEPKPGEKTIVPLSMQQNEGSQNTPPPTQAKDAVTAPAAGD